MRILVSIDDTDNLESRGTGEIASLIAEALQQKGWGSAGMVTRHQLLVHPDIPYTSHNSAMCFPAEIEEGRLNEVISFAGSFLNLECAPGSDPGLCVAPLENLAAASELVAFGKRAKKEVLTMPEAYQLAERLGVHLSEHGGTGQGVIGALAGAGLRLSGNDGRMKGALRFGGRETLPVAELLNHPDIDEVRSVEGGAPRADDLVAIGEKPKTVLLDGASVLLISALKREGGEAAWQTVYRKQLRGY
jgi:hypothetical protein